MIRSCYVLLLRLHPRSFRRRYAEEMLWIFDETAGPRARIRLFPDALLSLWRQWALRPEFRHEPATALARRTFAGAPAFYTFESSMPRLSSLLNGLLLSVAVFGAAAFLISHGKTTGLIKLPRVELPSRDIMPDTIVAGSAAAAGHDLGGERPTVRPPPAGFPLAPGAALATGQAVPAGRDTRVAESHHPSSTVQVLPQGSLRLKTVPHGTPQTAESQRGFASSQAAYLMWLLDRNGDGRISQDETVAILSELRQLLRLADRNEDGFVSMEELQKTLTGNSPQR